MGLIAINTAVSAAHYCHSESVHNLLQPTYRRQADSLTSSLVFCCCFDSPVHSLVMNIAWLWNGKTIDLCTMHTFCFYRVILVKKCALYAKFYGKHKQQHQPRYTSVITRHQLTFIVIMSSWLSVGIRIVLMLSLQSLHNVMEMHWIPVPHGAIQIILLLLLLVLSASSLFGCKGQKLKKNKNRHEGWQLYLYGDTPPLNRQLPNLAWSVVLQM